MPAKTVREVQVRTAGFEKGINLQDAPDQLEPTEVKRAENGTLDERGGFTKRLGCQDQGIVGNSSDLIISTYVFYRGDAVAPIFMVHTSAGEVWINTNPTISSAASELLLEDGTDLLLEDGTAILLSPAVSNFTQIGSGYSTTQPMSWETFNGKVYFCDGVSSYSSYDGATLITFPSAPKAKYLRLWKDTMWAAGIANYPDRVYSSAIGDAETWPVSGWVDIRKGDGDAVRALATDGIYLLVGKRLTGSLITDPALLYNRVYDFEKGIESHWSVIQHEEKLFYLTRRGVAEWQGDAPAKLISYKIDPLFDPHVLNYNGMDTAWAYTHGHRVAWCIPEAGQAVPTMQINYYPRLAELTALGVRGLGPWSIDRMPVQCPSLWRWQTDLILFGGSTITNKLYWMFADSVGTDDGATFSALLETGIYDFGSPILTKHMRRMRVLGRGIFNVSLRRNYEEGIYKTIPLDLSVGQSHWGDDAWGDSAWGPTSKTSQVAVHPDAYGRCFSLVFQDADVNTSIYDVPVGSKDTPIPTGNWSILGVVMDAYSLGVRP